MIAIIDLERYANDVLEYIQLHLGELYGEVYDDGAYLIDTPRYRPDQLFVYETILAIALSQKSPTDALDEGVTKIYQALYPRCQDVGTIRISMMLEEILSTDAYCGIVREIDKVKHRLHMEPTMPVHYKMHRKVTNLVIEVVTGEET